MAGMRGTCIRRVTDNGWPYEQREFQAAKVIRIMNQIYKILQFQNKPKIVRLLLSAKPPNLPRMQVSVLSAFCLVLAALCSHTARYVIWLVLIRLALCYGRRIPFCQNTVLPELSKRYSSTVTKPLAVRATQITRTGKTVFFYRNTLVACCFSQVQ